MTLSRAYIDKAIAIARERAALMDALRKALEAHDHTKAIRLARAACGLEEADESQPDRSDPPLNG